MSQIIYNLSEAKMSLSRLLDRVASGEEVGGTLARLKSVSEMLADVVEATKDLNVVKAPRTTPPRPRSS